MEEFYPVAIITLLTCFMYFGMALAVAKVHAITGIPAPAMSGDPRLERAVRAQANSLEWAPIFLPALWLFAFYWSAAWAAVLGALWLVARVAYFVGYLKDAPLRYPGFIAQVLVSLVLMVGALVRMLFLWVS